MASRPETAKGFAIQCLHIIYIALAEIILDPCFLKKKSCSILVIKLSIPVLLISDLPLVITIIMQMQQCLMPAVSPCEIN